MNINLLSPAFLVPATLSILMLTIPISIFTNGRLSFLRVFIYAITIYSLIVVLNFTSI